MQNRMTSSCICIAFLESDMSAADAHSTFIISTEMQASEIITTSNHRLTSKRNLCLLQLRVEGNHNYILINGCS